MPFLPAVVTIQDLPTATTLTGAELFEVVQTIASIPTSVQVPLSQVSSFAVDAIQTTPVFLPATALPAGGSTAVGLQVSSAPNLGIYFGTGAPTFAAGTGSLYINGAPTNATTRLYINTNGSTTWAHFTASA